MSDLGRFLAEPDQLIREVMARIGKGFGLAIVVDSEGRLSGTVTDGDIRRAILAGVDVDQPLQILLDERGSNDSPLTAPVGTPDSRLLQMMAESTLRHVPLLNEAGQVVDVAVLNELVKDYELPVTSVVMAGGFGSRLRPLTDDVPKPMLPLGDRPLLEHIIDQLRTAGVRKLSVTTHYKGELIEEHFGDGSNFGMDIQYVDEQEPLGTAGGLSLVEVSDEPVLVINGDIVTKLDIRAMLDFHRHHEADMTVAVREQELTIPYGVVEIDGVDLTSLTEKPTSRYLMNAGIYLLAPETCRSVPSGKRYDMTDLILDLLAAKRKVVGFPIQEYWADIGELQDYERAQRDARQEGTGG